MNTMNNESTMNTIIRIMNDNNEETFFHVTKDNNDEFFHVTKVNTPTNVIGEFVMFDAEVYDKAVDYAKEWMIEQYDEELTFLDLPCQLRHDYGDIRYYVLTRLEEEFGHQTCKDFDTLLGWPNSKSEFLKEVEDVLVDMLQQ